MSEFREIFPDTKGVEYELDRDPSSYWVIDYYDGYIRFRTYQEWWDQDESVGFGWRVNGFQGFRDVLAVLNGAVSNNRIQFGPSESLRTPPKASRRVEFHVRDRKQVA